MKQFYAEREEKKKVAFQNLKCVAPLRSRPIVSIPHACVRRATEHGPTGAKGASWSNVSGLVDLSEKGRKNEKDTTKLKCVRSQLCAWCADADGGVAGPSSSR